MATEHSHRAHQRLAMRTPLQKTVGIGMIGLVYLAGAVLMGVMLMTSGPEVAPIVSDLGLITSTMTLMALIFFGQTAAIPWARAARLDGWCGLGPHHLASACLWSVVLLAIANGGYVVYRATLADFLLIPLFSLMALMPGLMASIQTRRTVRGITSHAQGY